ncbi:unnamed protein product [Effrenium voratum]|nr:unnamed protein product [Effrenium voratum]
MPGPGAIWALVLLFAPGPSFHWPLRCALAEDPLLHDPDGLLERSLQADTEILPLLRSFQSKMSGPHLGQWAIHLGVALTDATVEPLSTTAHRLAQDLGFNSSQPGLLLVLHPELGLEVAGSLLWPGNEEFFRESAQWQAAEAAAEANLLAGKMGTAVQAAVNGALLSLTGSLELLVPHTSFKQRELHKWQSKFQVGEVWVNICGDRLCRELVLGDVRQLSDGFERYYHEAMTFPALNLLGPGAHKILILGGGDGGIATCALQFDTVHQVVNVDIDATVTEEAKRWFPKVAAGLDDPRCTMIHSDAFAWVAAHGSSKFDLVVIDFTDEPIEGAWSEDFFWQLRGVLTDNGLVVQNVGTISTPQEMQKIFATHALVFGSVFPMHATIPDYLGPYILALSSMNPKLRPEDVDWGHWRGQKIAAQYYGPDQHMALFAGIPADVCRLLGLPLELDQGAPSLPPAITLPLPLAKPAGKEKVLFRQKSAEGNKVKVTLEDTSYSLYQNWDAILSPNSWHRDEALLLPALTILGRAASCALVLGGGSGALASLALSWPVEKVVVLEVDDLVVQAAEKYFPREAAALKDPRTELIMADAFSWIATTQRLFDLVVVNMFDQPWLAAGRTTRVPRTRAFYRQGFDGSWGLDCAGGRQYRHAAVFWPRAGDASPDFRWHVAFGHEQWQPAACGGRG